MRDSVVETGAPNSSVGTAQADYVVECGLKDLIERRDELIKEIKRVVEKRGAGGGKPGEYRDLTEKILELKEDLKKVGESIAWQEGQLCYKQF
jgi:hypothetical protein